MTDMYKKIYTLKRRRLHRDVLNMYSYQQVDGGVYGDHWSPAHWDWMPGFPSKTTAKWDVVVSMLVFNSEYHMWTSRAFHALQGILWEYHRRRT